MIRRLLLTVVVLAVFVCILAPDSRADRPPATSICIGKNRSNDLGLYPFRKATSAHHSSSFFATAAAGTTYLAVFDFDSGPQCDDDGWVSVDLTAGADDFGDFAELYPALGVLELDPCYRSFGCLWAFYAGSTDDYGCGGYPAQPAVPRGSAQAGYIHNEVWSPLITLDGPGSQFALSFLVYLDLDLDDLVFYTWRVRSVTAGVPGDWCDRQTIYYGSNAVPRGYWYRHIVPVGDVIARGADEVQIALGVVDMCGHWCGTLGDGACHSHAPLFDEFVFVRIDNDGPQWHVEPVDLFQDNFAADGTVTGTVRIDIARDINPRASLSVRPGDSLVAWVGEPTVGLDYNETGSPTSGPAVYLHLRDVSPAKSGSIVSGDAVRWPVVSSSGGWTTLRFDSVRAAAGVANGQFCVDLNDELYTPGDTLYYYLSARDANGAVTYWTEFIGTTVSRSEAIAAQMEMTCLPAAGLGEGYVLYVDDTDNRGAQPYFDTAFQNLFVYSQIDRFDVRGADYLAGNGLGSRVIDVAQQLVPFYRHIIWCSGNLPHGLIGDGSGRPEKSPDAQVLAEFLRLNDRRGGLYISGDNVASELESLTGAGAVALRAFIDFTVLNNNHLAMGLPVNPMVKGKAGSMFAQDLSVDSLIAYGGCPWINTFDVLAAQGNATVAAEYREYPGGGGPAYGAIVSQRTVNDADLEQGVVLSGFSYHYIRDIDNDGIPDRYTHLHRILNWLDNPPDEPCGLPSVRAELTDDGVSVRWWVDWCIDANAYRVHRIVTTDTTLVGETDGNARFFLDRGAVAGRYNTYRVEGRESGEGWRNIGSAEIFVPAVISGFAAAVHELGIEVSWRIASAPGVDGFVLFRREQGAEEWTELHRDPLGPSTRRYLDKTVVPGTTYEYHLDVIYIDAGALGGGEATATARASLALAQNFPNPFNSPTRIGFTVPSPTFVEIKVFDVGGRKVTTLVNGVVSPAGYHEVEWKGEADNGSAVPSGVYFYRMSAAGKTFTKKLVIVR